MCTDRLFLHGLFTMQYGNDGQGLGGKARAVSARLHKILQGPNGLKLGFSAFALVVLLMYFIIHIFNKDVLLIVSLFAELVRLFGVLIITVNLRSAGSKASNISLMSQKFYLVVFGTRLIFKLFYEDFDFIYVVVESSALIATGYIIFMLTTVAKREAAPSDSESKFYFLPLICFLVALVLHPKVASNNFVFNTLWAFSTYLECLSLLPQVMKIQGQLKSEHGKGKPVDPAVANYIAALFVSRILEGCFWIIALYIKKYARIYNDIPYYVISTELVHTALLVQFIVYYVRHYKEYTKMSLGPIGI